MSKMLPDLMHVFHKKKNNNNNDDTPNTSIHRLPTVSQTFRGFPTPRSKSFRGLGILKRHHNHHPSAPPRTKAGMHGVEPKENDERVLYRGLFPLRQKFEPKIPYPAWDDTWETNEQSGSSTSHFRGFKGGVRRIVTRHVILIRHGQYNENGYQDKDKTLTELGRRQALLTGQRLNRMILKNNEKDGKCVVKVVCSSTMTRAKETADIIEAQLDSNEGVDRAESDPLLCEGWAVHQLPHSGTPDYEDRLGIMVNAIDRDYPRLEEAFWKYVSRSKWLEGYEERAIQQQQQQQEEEQESKKKVNTDDKSEDNRKKIIHEHEYEIIVAHSNIIRYFLCRALQLPPEAWARFEVMHCSISYLVVKSYGHVVCRMMGDCGHLDYDDCSVDIKVGLAWTR